MSASHSTAFGLTSWMKSRAEHRTRVTSTTFATRKSESFKSSTHRSSRQTKNVHTYLGGGLQYLFDVTGPANSFVPLDFSANFNIGNERWLTGSPISFNASAVPTGQSSTQSVVAEVSCGNQQFCHPGYVWASSGASSTVQVNIQSSTGVVHENGSVYGLTTAYGTITGNLMAPTNAAGQSTGVVDIRSFAAANGFVDYPRTPGVSWAFIDPKFEVTPAYLALHPSAALPILPGVGNESALMPVPEPALALLMTGGALGLFAAMRRRKVLARHPG